MGHKTHPLGFRLGITQEHKSTWYSKLKTYSELIKEDSKIRKIILDYLKDNYVISTGIAKIVINREPFRPRTNVVIHTSRPGVLVGEKGSGLDQIDKSFTKAFPNKKTRMDIVEIEETVYHADLIADTLVRQLEERTAFRRAMKETIQKVQEKKATLLGIKIQIAGRVNGAEIARTEWLREGRVPCQTLRANIDYSSKTAKTVHGILGIKIWLFKKDSTVF